MTEYVVQAQFRDIMGTHKMLRTVGSFDDRKTAEDFRMDLERECPGFDSVKVVQE